MFPALLQLRKEEAAGVRAPSAPGRLDVGTAATPLRGALSGGSGGPGAVLCPQTRASSTDSSPVLLMVTPALAPRAVPRGGGLAGRPSFLRALGGGLRPPLLPLLSSPAGLWKPEAAS